MPNDNTHEFKCRITYMYKNCPKPDGWFGCYARTYGSNNEEIKLTGTTTLPLTKDSQIEVIAEKIGENEYKAIHISLVTKTSKGMITYLASLPGISRVTARKLVTLYGTDAIDMIKTKSAEVQAELAITDQKMKAIIDSINKNDEFNQLRRFLIEIQSNAVLVRIMEAIADPINEIKANPYMLTDIPGITFQTADTIALRLGEHPLSPYRVNHGLVHVLKTNYTDDMYVDLSDTDQCLVLMCKVESLLNIRFTSEQEFKDRINIFAAIKNSPIYIDKSNNSDKMYLSELYHNMMALVRIIKDKISRNNRNISTHDIMNNIYVYESNNNINLTKEQKDCCQTALRNEISIITGGPGRGKTSVIDCIAMCWRTNIRKTVTLLAPTGKAMNKLKTATHGQYQTMTIDKLIASNIMPNNPNKTTKINKIKDTEDNLFIVDESSMIDIIKAANLLSLYPKSTYCFVGDVDQLPPIQPGHFLKDLINSQIVPVSYLTIPLRNSGSILSNAEKINHNDTDLQWDFTNMPFYPQANDDETALNAIIDQYNDERTTCADITQLALLCPMRKGLLGSVNLNITIQNIMCPENEQQQTVYDANHKRYMFIQKGHPIRNTIYGNKDRYTKFRIGDIVMCTKNNNTVQTFIYDNNDYWNGKPISKDTGIYNGDCGKIIAYIPSDNNLPLNAEDNHDIIVVQFFDNRIANIDLTNGDFETFDLGYALTVHKSQGCEYQTVIYVSPCSLINLINIGFGNKNLVYTAVTRAKTRVVVMGSKDALNACIQTNAKSHNSDFVNKLTQ